MRKRMFAWCCFAVALTALGTGHAVEAGPKEPDPAGARRQWPFGEDPASADPVRRDLFNLGPIGAKVWEADRPEARRPGPGIHSPPPLEHPGIFDAGPPRLVVCILCPGGPAAKAGLRVGDVIVGAGGTPFDRVSLDAIAREITAAESGDGAGVVRPLVEGTGPPAGAGTRDQHRLHDGVVEDHPRVHPGEEPARPARTSGEAPAAARSGGRREEVRSRARRAWRALRELRTRTCVRLPTGQSASPGLPPARRETAAMPSRNTPSALADRSPAPRPVTVARTGTAGRRIAFATRVAAVAAAIAAGLPGCAQPAGPPRPWQISGTLRDAATDEPLSRESVYLHFFCDDLSFQESLEPDRTSAFGVRLPSPHVRVRAFDRTRTYHLFTDTFTLTTPETTRDIALRSTGYVLLRARVVDATGAPVVPERSGMATPAVGAGGPLFYFASETEDFRADLVGLDDAGCFEIRVPRSVLSVRVVDTGLSPAERTIDLSKADGPVSDVVIHMQ